MKNYMKLLLASLLVGASLSAAQSSINYRKATIADVNALMEIYDQFDENDAHNLLLFPIEMRQDVLVGNLKKGRIFVATVKEDSDEKIVAFAKAFFVTDDEERKEIMRQEELRINPLLVEKGSTKCLSHGMYIISKSSINDYNQQLKLIEMSPEAHDHYEQIYLYDAPCAYVYVGGMYTIKGYRDQGINTKILRYALNSLQDEIKLHFHNNSNCKYIALLYGQVDANAHQKIQVRPFVDLVIKVCDQMNISLDDQLDVCYASYLSYKPEITMTSTGPQFSFNVEKNRGRGNILLVNIRR